jgi:hypothetical protein
MTSCSMIDDFVFTHYCAALVQQTIYVGHSNLNEHLVPSRAQINLYERACADKL